MRFLTLCFLLAGFIAGCSAFTPSPEPQPNVVAHVKAAPPKPITRRDFGSLWSDDSIWNDIYSVSAPRTIGDLVMVKLDENLKMMIIERYDKMIPPSDEVLEKEKPKEEEDPTKQKAATASVALEKKKEEQALRIVRTTVRENRPRGMYYIEGSDTLKFSFRKAVVSIEGLVRDRDVDASDMISSEQVLNLKLDVKPAVDPPTVDLAQGTNATQPIVGANP